MHIEFTIFFTIYIFLIIFKILIIFNHLLKIFNKYILVSFKTRNSFHEALKLPISKSTEKCSRVYKIKCDDCDSFYIGRAGRNFQAKCREHLPRSNSNNPKLNFIMHIVSSNHSHSNFTNNLKEIHLCKQGIITDVWEVF